MGLGVPKLSWLCGDVGETGDLASPQQVGWQGGRTLVGYGGHGCTELTRRRWGIFHWCLDQAQDEVLDLPGPCGFKGAPQRKPSVPHNTALSPRIE